MSSFPSGPHRSSAKIREDAVCNPLLRSIDNINVTFPFSNSGNASNIRTSCRNGKSANQLDVSCNEKGNLTVGLSHAQAKSNISLQHIREEASLLFFISKIDNRRPPNRVPTPERPNNTEVSAASQLVDHNDVMESIPLVGVDVAGKSLAIQVVHCQRE